MNRDLPDNIRRDLRRARRLGWWTLAWMTSIVIVMWLVMGSSQAMKTATIEDVLSLVPAAAFLIACHFEARPPTRRYPFGLERVHSLSALIAAVALTGVGGFLVYDSATTLWMGDHPTIASISLFGQTLWHGWLMVAALVYSVVPPVILGRLKLPVARRLQDKVLHTDAMMQKADWMTGLAGVAGVIGVGLGYWWADAAAAAIISFSILWDGISSLRIATAELVDGTPRALDNDEIAEDAEALIEALARRYPGADVKLRETGRYIHAQIAGVEPEPRVEPRSLWPGDPERAWRLVQVSFVPPKPQGASRDRVKDQAAAGSSGD